ncbi:hypothetical protein COMA2_110052 [Candidatus Nitrospira nitrificans]|uniref:Uncharacterized protein n=1 Tax=Candidatus Nitrospira nitrificans TaxID=1742973 RepID=A0A0S4LA62_9BACT|nr:hypothetical protein COMA2_110052 [Candidatus Nitrospira nitrificans]
MFLVSSSKSIFLPDSKLETSNLNRLPGWRDTAGRLRLNFGVWFVRRKVFRTALARPFVPSSHQDSFLKIKIAVTDDRRAFPIFENPFFLPYAVFGERRIDGLWSAPRLQNLFFGHSHHDTVLFDVLVKVRVTQLNDLGPDHDHKDKQYKSDINDDPNRAAANERRLFSVGIKGEGLRFGGHGAQESLDATSEGSHESRIVQ